MPASPPLPEESEAPPRLLPTDAQDLGRVSHGWEGTDVLPSLQAFYSGGPACRHQRGGRHACAGSSALAQDSVLLPVRPRRVLVFPWMA